jgi:hypothetical protein
MEVSISLYYGIQGWEGGYWIVYTGSKFLKEPDFITIQSHAIEIPINAYKNELQCVWSR